MRSHFFIILACLLTVSPVWGEAVSENEARQIAASFMSKHFKGHQGGGPHLAYRQHATMAGATTAYYVFNADQRDGGYVIVAGDDRVPQVLGYSDEGTFDINDVPEAMQELLDGYAAQIAALGMGGEMATHITSSRPVAPLVKATWSQNSPYYIQLPFRPNGQHALVGCVATAVAQVMHYWKWPSRPTGPIPAYVSNTLEFNMPELPPVDFNWANMQDTYFTTDTVSVAGQEAATLSLYCAQALQADFKEGATSAKTRNIPNALVHYFGYSPDMKILNRSLYTTPEWESMILDELTARRPVIYVGSKLSSAHAFICDGYDGNGMFHFNWGWNGKCNGYFLLNVLNPELQGSGSASGTYGYILSQTIVTGVQPGSTSHNELNVYNEYLEIKDCIESRNSVNEDFKVIQETHLLNCASDTIDFKYAWGLYQGNHLVKILESGIKYNLPSWYYTRLTYSLFLGSGISSGEFRIIPIYCEMNTEDWRPCPGSDINYIDVIIDGNHCSFISHGDATSPSYKINDISVEGNMHPRRPISLTLNVTNQGYTRNDAIYMFADDKIVSVGFADVPNGETCNVELQYYPESTGSVTLRFTLDEDGEQVVGTKVITINQMPSATLRGTAEPLNIADEANKIIYANEFAANVNVTNTGTTTYDEDITFYLYKWIYENRGSSVQVVTQHLTLAPQASRTLTFHLDNVTDGWNYFAYVYYYSSGEQIRLAGIGSYTVVFPPAVVTGDVNGDGVVNISDINVLIQMILTDKHSPAGDVNGDGQINISDINAAINIILTGN